MIGLVLVDRRDIARYVGRRWILLFKSFLIAGEAGLDYPQSFRGVGGGLQDNLLAKV